MIEKTFPITEKLLANCLLSIRKLYELLNTEHDHLQQTIDPTVLFTLSSNKKELVAQLEQFSNQLRQILSIEELLIEKAGVVKYLEKAKLADFSTNKALQYWLDIETLSKKCKSLNEQNAASIDLLSRYTQRSLQVLRGKSQLTSTYGPDGNTRSVLFSHTLISV